MTSSPTEMRTTAVTKPAVKTSCHGCSCREDALVNSHQNLRKPRQTTTPTLSGYLRSHPSPNSGYAQESYNLRPRQTTTPTQSGYLRSHQQVPTVATPKRATISDQDYVHGWTTPRQSGYLHAIASAQGSASQLQKIVHENKKSQIQKTFQHQALSFVKDSIREDIINTEVSFWHLSSLLLQTTAAAHTIV